MSGEGRGRGRGSQTVTYFTRSTEDYGSLLCYASNSIGHRGDPCVSHIIPSGQDSPKCHTSYPQVRISPNSRHKLFMSGQKAENHERANMSQICVNTSAFAQDIIKRDPQVIMAEQIKRNRDISVRDAFKNRRKFPFLIDFIFEQPQ